jgi:ATP-dependent RNA helicase DDX52/ROK1
MFWTMPTRGYILKGVEPPVLVFVQSQERANELFSELVYEGINCNVIHAGKTQSQRQNIIESFRLGKVWFLICTALLSRGVDFPALKMVINYDMPASPIQYIHSVGRTGRAGKLGKSVTFFTEDDSENLRRYC